MSIEVSELNSAVNGKILGAITIASVDASSVISITTIS